ncbi:MAG: apolipoprotein N-acyltransferase [Actinomycetota bacterium]|nr:apolipoprotein N-acyltransferase [Actinomycetota bacterium]
MSTAATDARAPGGKNHPVQHGPAPVRSGPLLPSVLAAAGSGVLATAAFPPFDLWFLAVPAVMVLTLLCRGQRPRRAALLGLVAGLALFLPLLAWMRIIGSDAWVALALLEAAFYAAMGALISVVGRQRLWPLWAACLWVGQELARATVPFGGFPWGRLAFAETASPFTPYAALGGASLVTFATAASGTLLAAAVVHRHRRAWSVRALLAALAVPVAALAVPLPTDGPRTTAALVQGGVARPGLDFLGQREEVLRKHVAATNKLIDDVDAGRTPRPDLIIWPENASDIDPFTDAGAFSLIDATVRRTGVPVLVGSLVDGPGPDHVSNVGIVWSPVSGPGMRYVKRHPVPFGEYIPFRAELAGLFRRLDQIPRDFAAGPRPGVLEVGPARVGDVICFEVAYDGLVRDVVDGGARLLVVQTNNATYNGTGQPAQQLAMSRLRAVEHGRAVLVAATSGISAIIAPDGTVLARSRELRPVSLVSAVPLRDGRTVADRLGAWPEWLLAGAGLAAAATSVVAARRASGRQ